jgi:hypothetical protein
MSKAQYTKGIWERHPMSYKKPFIVTPREGEEPWVAYNHDIGVGELRICTVIMQTAKSGYPHVTTQEECDANARLIAAAPELLEIALGLNEAMKSPHGEFQNRCAILADKARAAIAKATGEEYV